MLGRTLLDVFFQNQRHEPSLENRPETLEEIREALAKGLAEGHCDTRTVRDFLEKLYGKEIADKVFQAIARKSSARTAASDLGPNGSLSRNAILEILVYAANEIKVNDVKACQAMFPGISEAEAIERLENPLPFICHDPSLNLIEESQKAGLHLESIAGFAFYYNEVKKIANSSRQNSSYEDYVGPEALARNIAYLDPNEDLTGRVVPVYLPGQNEIVFCEIAKQIKHNGLNADFLRPMPGQPPETPSILLFRGTNDYQSALRDLDPRGIGHSTFDEVSDQIIAEIKREISEDPDAGKTLWVAGHSLGAADAQRAMVSIVDAYKHGALPGLKGVDLYAYASPKLDRKTCDEWQRVLAESSAAGDALGIRLFFAQHESDYVARAGHDILRVPEEFSPKKSKGCPEGVRLQSSYLTFADSKGYRFSHFWDRILHPHCQSFFKDGEVDPSFTILRNSQLLDVGELKASRKALVEEFQTIAADKKSIDRELAGIREKLRHKEDLSPEETASLEVEYARLEEKKAGEEGKLAEIEKKLDAIDSSLVERSKEIHKQREQRKDFKTRATMAALHLARRCLVIAEDVRFFERTVISNFQAIASTFKRIEEAGAHWIHNVFHMSSSKLAAAPRSPQESAAIKASSVSLRVLSR